MRKDGGTLWYVAESLERLERSKIQQLVQHPLSMSLIERKNWVGSMKIMYSGSPHLLKNILDEYGLEGQNFDLHLQFVLSYIA